MAAELITLPFRPVINVRGVLEPGALLDVFAAGTTTRVTVYSDAGLTTALENPVVADASGVFPTVYFDNASTVRVRVRAADGSTIGDADPYLSDGLDIGDISFLPSGSGAVARTVESKFGEFPSVKDFGAVGNGTNNDTSAINTAVAAQLFLRWPAGIYMVDTLPTPASGAIWVADGNVTIRRRASSTANVLLFATNPVTVEGITFDGNKAASSVACNCVIVTASQSKFNQCRFVNAKAVGGAFGSGITYDEAAISNDSDHVLWDCYAASNDSDGFSGQNMRGLEAIGNTASGNLKNGFQFNNYDVTLTDKLYDCRLIGNYAYGNGQNGIYVGNFIESNSLVTLDYGPLNPDSYRFIIADNVCRNNNFYGIAAQGEGLSVSSNTCVGNAVTDPTTGGILMNASLSQCSDNIVYSNSGFGIDAGGSVSSIVQGNTVYINSGTGLNVGASVNLKAAGNHVLGNGGTNGIQIEIHNVDTDAAGKAFSALTQRLVVSENYVSLTTATQRGIYMHDGVDGVIVADNDFFGSNPENFIIAIASRPTIQGNRVPTTLATLLSVSGGGVVAIPDVFAFGYTNSTTTVTSLDYHTAQNVVGRTGIGWVTVTNGGTGYTSAPTVTITGGGGSGAAATAHIRNGVVIGVRMTNFGTGYTSAPTIGFTGGGGSGATGTAQVSVPLADGREFELYTAQACTINRSATPVVESKAAANLSMGARDAARMRGLFGQWNVLGRA